MVRALGSGLRRGLLADGGGLDRLALDPTAQIGLVGQRLALRPAGTLAQRLQARLGRRLGLGDDAEETAVAYHGNDTRGGSRRRLIEPRQPRARRRRPEHTPVQHAGQRHVMNETRAAENLVGNIETPCRGADEPAGRYRLGCRAGSGVASEQGVVRQLPIAGAQVAGADDGPVLHLQALGRHAQPLRGYCKIYRTRLRAGVA